MRTLIVGATGFIGRKLIRELLATDHQLVAVSRNANKAREILGNHIEILEWDGKTAEILSGHLEGIEAIVNLAGENIASRKWTKDRKNVLIDSRIETGRLLSEAILMSGSRPGVLIQGSATGFYGTPVDKPADENHPYGSGFLAGLTQAWESAVEPAGSIIPRIVFIRTGLVLGRNGGLLEKMLLPFKLYSGTTLGSGKQWMSWVHIEDVVKAIRFLLESESAAGPYNLTAPNPVQMKSFIRSVSTTLGKPAWLKVPGIFLKAVLGEMAKETVLANQNIIPARLLNEGYEFRFDHLDSALVNLLIDENR